MASTTFVNGITAVDASWLNDVNDNTYELAYANIGFGATLNSATLQAALSSGAKTVRLRGNWTIDSNVTVPLAVNVLADHGTTITSNGSANFIVSGSNVIENITFNFGSSARRVVGDGVANVVFRNCSVTGSTGNGFDLYNGPTDITFDSCASYSNGGYGIAILGSVAVAPNRITITNCKTYNNSYDGICVSGVGQRTSPAQTANYASNIIINGCISYSNGSGGSFNGITTPYCRYVSISNCTSYSNQEHGIALQETYDFIITGNICHSNGQDGICAQSGYDPYNPTARGTITGNNCYSNTNAGIEFKEKVEYVVLTGNSFANNTAYSVRFRDIGGSGLYSSYITFVGNTFSPSSGGTIANSNSSLYVTSSAAYNYSGSVLQPNQADTATINTAVTIDTRGTLLNYPEVFVITNTGAQVSRTGIQQASLGRKIILLADGSGAVDVRHNQGDGVTYAGFLLSTGATITLGAWKSITFIGNGTNWVEISKNT